VNRYCEQQPDSALAKVQVVPSYILVGDQSAGKTSLLSRLAQLPLGYTANKTGTRRPVEYNLIHDDTKEDPDIVVDSESVREADFLKRMTEKNDVEGFSNEAVSVKILWKNIPESIIVADMPGMKDKDTEPERMILERLKRPNVIPVVVLEPKDFDSKNYAFDLLTKADRSYDDIIVVVNKCDEKLSKNGDWSTPSTWKDFWTTARKKGFKAIYLTGWPLAGDRNEPDMKTRKEQLHQSCDDEARLIADWKERVKIDPQAAECVGLDKFSKSLHQDQRSRLDEMSHKVIQHIRNELRLVNNRMHETRTNSSAKALRAQTTKLMHRWARKSNELLEGHVDVHDLRKHCHTAEEDIQWLSKKAMSLFEELPTFDEQQRERTEAVLRGQLFSLERESDGSSSKGWIHLMANAVDATYEPLLGKAAICRVLDMAFLVCLCRVFQHALMEFDEKFIRNVMSEHSQDSGNKVILKFVERVLEQSFHPLVDVVSLLAWKHMQICIASAQKSRSDIGGTIGGFLKDVHLESGFMTAAEQYVREELKKLNTDMHKRVEEQGLGLQARFRKGHDKALACNTAGIVAAQDPRFVAMKEPGFPSSAASFLETGMEGLVDGSKYESFAYFYEVLLSCARIMQSEASGGDHPADKMFLSAHSEVDADGKLHCNWTTKEEVIKVRSHPIPVKRGASIQVNLNSCNVTPAPTSCPQPPGNSRWSGKSIEPAEPSPEPQTHPLHQRVVGNRSDEQLLDKEAPFLLVAVNDYMCNKWVLCKDPKDGQAIFEAKELEAGCGDRLVNIDVIVFQRSLTIDSISFGNPGAEEVAPTTARAASSARADSSARAEVETSPRTQAAERNKTAKEQMRVAQQLLESMQSKCWPLAGSRCGGMDYRKLLIDVSSELIEQSKEFRRTLESRLQVWTRDLKRDLGCEIDARLDESVFMNLEEQQTKELEKLEDLDGILNKALGLYQDSRRH
ncbi:unnamed protein product, partial [Effrenium voratum]